MRSTSGRAVSLGELSKFMASGGGAPHVEDFGGGVEEAPFSPIDLIGGGGAVKGLAVSIRDGISVSILRIAGRSSSGNVIEATGPLISGTLIPSTMILKNGSGSFYVNSNATKHLAEEFEYLLKGSADSLLLKNKLLMEEFSNAAAKASARWNGTRQLLVEGRWEFGFDKAFNGKFPVIFHSRGRKS